MKKQITLNVFSLLLLITVVSVIGSFSTVNASLVFGSKGAIKITREENPPQIKTVEQVVVNEITATPTTVLKQDKIDNTKTDKARLLELELKMKELENRINKLEQ